MKISKLLTTVIITCLFMICNMNILARELDRADDVIDPGL